MTRVLMLILILQCCSLAATYYLDCDASGANNGSSWENAWETIGDAQTGMAAKEGDGSGDTVLVAEGTYVEQYYETNTETRTDYLAWKANPGDTVVWRHEPDDDNQNAIYLNGGTHNYYLKFEGLRVESRIYVAAGAGYVYIKDCNVGGYETKFDTAEPVRFPSSGSHHITIEDCDIHTGTKGVDLGTISNLILRHNNIHDCCVWGAIAHNLIDSVIELNHIHNVSPRYMIFEDYLDEYVFVSADGDNVTVNDEYKQQMSLEVAEGFGTGVMAYINFDPAVSFTTPNQMCKMRVGLESSIELDPNTLAIRISENENGAVSANSVDINLPVLLEFNNFNYFTIGDGDHGLTDEYPDVNKLDKVKSIAVLLNENKGAFTLEMGNTTYYGLRVSDPHHTNFLVVSGKNVQIKKNILHNGSVDKVFFTMSGINLEDSVVENNLVYDIRANRILALDVTGDITFRNNTLIGTFQNGYETDYYYSGRFKEGCGTIDIQEGPNNVTICNNLVFGQYLSSNGSYNDYNIAQSQYTYGDNSYIISVEEDKKAEDFFVTYDFSPNNERYDLDYHHKASSIAINFGNPDKQPSDSLGSNEPNGFIADDGLARSAAWHSVGAYEYETPVTTYYLLARY